jgi:hypothetical protein
VNMQRITIPPTTHENRVMTIAAINMASGLSLNRRFFISLISNGVFMVKRPLLAVFCR